MAPRCPEIQDHHLAGQGFERESLALVRGDLEFRRHRLPGPPRIRYHLLCGRGILAAWLELQVTLQLLFALIVLQLSQQYHAQASMDLSRSVVKGRGNA